MLRSVIECSRPTSLKKIVSWARSCIAFAGVIEGLICPVAERDKKPIPAKQYTQTQKHPYFQVSEFIRNGWHRDIINNDRNEPVVAWLSFRSRIECGREAMLGLSPRCGKILFEELSCRRPMELWIAVIVERLNLSTSGEHRSHVHL